MIPNVSVLPQSPRRTQRKIRYFRVFQEHGILGVGTRFFRASPKEGLIGYGSALSATSAVKNLGWLYGRAETGRRAIFPMASVVPLCERRSVR